MTAAVSYLRPILLYVILRTVHGGTQRLFKYTAMSTYFFLVRKFNHGPNDPSPVGTTNPRLNIPSEMLQRLLCDSHAKATRSAISRRHFSLQYDTSYNDFGTEPCPSIGGLPSTNSYLFINNNTVTPSISYYCHPSYYCHSYSGTRL